MDEKWRQDSRRDGSGTGSRICILCNQSGNGKNIPVVGGLFEILQDNVSFFGDFSDHATTLEAVDGTKTDSSETDGAKTDHANNDAIYTKTADGLTITCSEVYANSQAIYVTMQFKSDKPFPETETGAESGTPVIDLDMTGVWTLIQRLAR